MKISHFIKSLTIAATLAAPMLANAATVTYAFNLNGAQEVPPSATAASGSAQITINDVAGTISFVSATFSFSSDLVAAHLHKAPPGIDGPVVYDLLSAIDAIGPVTVGAISIPGSLVFAGTSKPIDIALAVAINASPFLYYMNIHTTAFPGGEVRGQLASSPVPLPGAFWLFAPAIGLGVLRRRIA